MYGWNNRVGVFLDSIVTNGHYTCQAQHIEGHTNYACLIQSFVFGFRHVNMLSSRIAFIATNLCTLRDGRKLSKLMSTVLERGGTSDNRPKPEYGRIHELKSI
jgi:hypothetical protein